MIERGDLQLFQFADDPAVAFDWLKTRLTAPLEAETPSFAHSQTSNPEP